MPTTLTAVSDPVQAHNLWEAGLLVNAYGASWGVYSEWVDEVDYNHPCGNGFVLLLDDWFILLED